MVIHRQANNDNNTPKLLVCDFNVSGLVISDGLKIFEKEMIYVLNYLSEI